MNETAFIMLYSMALADTQNKVLLHVVGRSYHNVYAFMIQYNK